MRREDKDEEEKGEKRLIDISMVREGGCTAMWSKRGRRLEQGGGESWGRRDIE